MTVEGHLNGLARSLVGPRAQAPRLTRWGRVPARRPTDRGRLLAAGNGGSAAEAQHLTAELIGRFRDDRQPLAAETAGRVGVTLVIPGGMRTHFFDDRAERYRPPDDSKPNPPERVADAIVFASRRTAGCEVRELVVAHAEEGSWP